MAKSSARVPAQILNLLHEARRAATMESASFAFPCDKIIVDIHMENPKTLHPDEFIKETTRLYRESWIIGPLNRAIEWAEGKEFRK